MSLCNNNVMQCVYIHVIYMHDVCGITVVTEVQVMMYILCTWVVYPI